MNSGKLSLVGLILSSLLICGFDAEAQTSKAKLPPDTELLKLIEAGLPESTILNAIQAKAGQFDTSTDALIQLKKAGATEAELNALFAGPGVNAPAGPKAPPAVYPTLFDGQLSKTAAGDPYLQFQSAQPDFFPNGYPTNSAYLVVYKGEVGVLIPSSVVGSDCFPENLVIQKQRIVTQNYVSKGCVYKPRALDKRVLGYFKLEEYPREQVTFKRNVSGSIMSGQVAKELKMSWDELTFPKPSNYPHNYVFGMYPFNFRDSSVVAMRSVAMELFAAQLFENFDETVATFQQAAGITDPETQLSAQAHFREMTQVEIEKANLVATQRSDERGGNGWLNLLQTVQAVQQGRSGIANTGGGLVSGNSAQFNQGLNELAGLGNSVAQPVGRLSQPQVIAAPADPVEAAKNEQLARIKVLSQANSSASAAHGVPPQNAVAAASVSPRVAGRGQSTPAGASRTVAELPATNPSFTSQDSNGKVTLGTGSPRACATSSSGSQLPLTPGTTAGTCNPASCRGLGFAVHLTSRWTDAKKTEVVGFFDNNSGGDATCTWAFHKRGVWIDEGQMYLKINEQHKGGEFGGVWSQGTDSSTIKYVCFEGIDPVDVHGKLCAQGVQFVGPTDAGTDK